MTDPLTGCEPCAYWSPDGCLKAQSGFPVVGDFCRVFEREPGVDDA